MSNTIVLEKSVARLIEPGIIEILFRSGKTIEVEDIIELRDVKIKLSEGKPCVVLVMAEELVNFTKETREFMSTKESAGATIAEALVSDGLAQKILGNFYLRVNKPYIKTKLFTNRNKALNWLKSEITKSEIRYN